MEGWYLNTGTSNHMTGRTDLLSQLDRAVHGTLWFGDRSVIPIDGRRIVTFLGKTGETRSPMCSTSRLKNSIISLGQLHEKGCSVQIEKGVLRGWNRRCRLLVKILRGKNRLYVLHINVAHGVSWESGMMEKQNVGMLAMATSAMTRCIS
jgi:hypothetical protein